MSAAPNFAFLGVASFLSTSVAVLAQDVSSIEGLYAHETCADYSEGGFWKIGSGYEFFVGDETSISLLEIHATKGMWLYVEDQRKNLYFLRKDEESGDIFYAFGKVSTVKTNPPPNNAATSDGTFDITRYVACDAMPIEIQVIFGETLAILDQIMPVIGNCSEHRAECASRLFGAFDIVEDGVLTRSELARGARAMSQYAILASDEPFSKEALVGTSAGAFAVAPIVSAGLLANFDYDASESLSLDEIIVSRLPYNLSFSGEFDDEYIREASEGLIEVARSLLVKVLR